MRFLLLFTFLALSNAFQCSHFRDIYHESNCCQDDGLLNCLHETPSCDTQGLDSNQICVDANNKRLIVAPKPAQVLEKLVLVADGRSVQGVNKTYVTDSVTVTEEVPDKNANPYFIDIPGSKISYVPPAGTRQVVIEFEFFLDVQSTSCENNEQACSHYGQISTWLMLGPNYQNIGFESWRSDPSRSKRELKYVVRIDPTINADDHTKSILKSWDTPINVSVQIMEWWSYSTKLVLFEKQTWLSTGLGTTVMPPTLTITAVGEGY